MESQSGTSSSGRGTSSESSANHTDAYIHPNHTDDAQSSEDQRLITPSDIGPIPPPVVESKEPQKSTREKPETPSPTNEPVRINEPEKIQASKEDVKRSESSNSGQTKQGQAPKKVRKEGASRRISNTSGIKIHFKTSDDRVSITPGEQMKADNESEQIPIVDVPQRPKRLSQTLEKV